MRSFPPKIPLPDHPSIGLYKNDQIKKREYFPMLTLWVSFFLYHNSGVNVVTVNQREDFSMEGEGKSGFYWDF